MNIKKKGILKKNKCHIVYLKYKNFNKFKTKENFLNKTFKCDNIICINKNAARIKSGKKSAGKFKCIYII